MTYTLDEAKILAEDFIKQSEEIHDLNLGKYGHDVMITCLLTQMEQKLGVQLLMNYAQSWSEKSEGNALLLATYRHIGNTRRF